MGLLSEFKDFALKGNVLDLAVGVIIGVAFAGVVGSLTGDIIMPVVGMAGNVNFTDSYLPLSKSATDAASAFAAANPGKVLALADAQKAGSVLAYGNFVTIVINFLILAFCIFLVVKAFNTARKRFEAQKPAPAPAGPTAEQKLLTEIRDLLARR